MTNMEITNETALKLTMDDIYGVGVDDYEALSNKPKINSVEVSGSKTLDDYGIASNDTLAKSVNSIQTQIGSMSTTSPTFVTSVSDMTDTTKNYVLTTSGTVYAYIDNEWTNTNVKYTGAGNTIIATQINIYGEVALNAHPEAKDFDTLPTNTIYMYSYSTNVKNKPADSFVGTVLTFRKDTKNVPDITTVQMAFHYSTAAFWWRTFSYDGYTNWMKCASTGYVKDAINTIEKRLVTYPSVALFETVGVIGDSYASGEVYDSNGVSQGDVYSISWPQIMARRNGIAATNFSSGGLTTRTWLTSSRGLTLLNSESAKKMYILALGINDEYGLGLDYLGSSSDIHVGSPSENADTFYGNYAKIIEAVKAKAPNAIILMATINGVSSIITKFNQAINEIASTYSLNVLDQQSNEFLASSWWINQKHGGHPTAPSYSGMAVAFEELIGRDMYNHPDYYNNYFGA